MALWNKFSYAKRLFLWLLCYSLLLVGCFVLFQYNREKEFKTESLNAQLQVINAEILNRIDSVEPSVPQHSALGNVRVSVIDSTGKVLYDNTLDTSTTDNHLDREEIIKALNSGSGFTVRRHSESTGGTYFYSATRGDNGLIVRTAVPYSLTLSSLLEADMGFLWVMGGVTLIMCILGYFATRRLGLHIMRLNRFAERAERGERIYDTAPFPKDELGSISNHIVKLYADLQQAVADRDREHKRALFAQKEKERIKKQLTNNINHELKTPIASIQVCMEILLSHNDLSEEKRREFMERCMANAIRLKRLIADVSQITRMDDAPALIAKEELNLTDIIAETVSDCEPMADTRGIVIINDIKSSITLHGNHSLLSSVFHNLIENALAYSGGNRVWLRILTDSPDRIVITVADNGCGVPAEHLPHLFERFYRIDKGRSRSAGGTGLGLSIVKNAVLLHHGSITVENRPDGGLLFTISFSREA